ncbi:hypothetical protein M422DRAFT_192391, partial [Sphaerobolus stellatus SS14]
MQKKANSSGKAEFAGTASALHSDSSSPLLLSFPGNDWVADTGASSHMTPHREWFHEYQHYVVPVRLANGVTIQSAGLGCVVFRP